MFKCGQCASVTMQFCDGQACFESEKSCLNILCHHLAGEDLCVRSTLGLDLYFYGLYFQRNAGGCQPIRHTPVGHYTLGHLLCKI